ncbi:unnamed protein product [Brassica oleracea]
MIRSNLSFLPCQMEYIHPLRNCNKAKKTTFFGVALFNQISKSHPNGMGHFGNQVLQPRNPDKARERRIK